MSLPKQIKNSQSGQILIIFLLVLVVGLAIVLSIASRTVTDVRQTTTSDESNRAYFAAESGVESALKLIQESSGYSGNSTVNLSNVNRSSAAVNVADLQPSAGTVAFEFPNKIAKDDVAQVSLMSDFNNLATAGGVAPSVGYNWTMEVSWGDPSLSASVTYPALEISIISCDGAPICSGNPAFVIHKMTFDPVALRTTNFCLANTGSYNLTTTESNHDFKFQASFKLNNRTTPLNCPSNDQLGTTKPVLARIRPLYNTNLPTTLAVRVSNAAGALQQLPKQGSLVTSIGSTPSGVTRKLTVTRLYPALPAIFDYVLYNGSNQPLSKP